MALTPMMQQYISLKEEHPDCILFFRLGDFYEMFFDDATTAAKELELVLTGRDCGLEEKAPMCGVPYHAANNYIGRLVEKGYKVAICEQMEDPALAKGLVERGVVRIVTPGTILDETFLKEDINSYLMAALKSSSDPSDMALAVVDITTGEFLTTSFPADLELLKGELAKYGPREILLFEKDEIYDVAMTTAGLSVTLRDLKVQEEEALLNHAFQEVAGRISPLGKLCVFGLLEYLKETQKTGLTHLNKLVAYQVTDTMALDVNTRRNLELTENIVDKKKRGSLLWVLDETKTAMGARNMRRWVEKPLIQPGQIQHRLEAVSALVENIALNQDLREALTGVYDLERLAGKVAQKAVNPRELLSLKNSLLKIPVIKDLLEQVNYGSLNKLGADLDDLQDVAEKIQAAISEDAGISVKEGSIIQPGYSSEVDELREIQAGGKRWIAALEAQERKATGVASLKVGYNKVFGYYLEVTKANLSKIPEGRYVRKQTLANAERYITPELKEMEEKILGAQDKILDLEYRLFADLRDEVETQTDRLKKTALAIADLDCFTAFAKVALDRNYVKPTFNDEGRILIKDGRHPVVEAMMPRGEFVSNDTKLDRQEDTFLVITGPNMAGKSTYMRQVALITLMAQLGSYVPAAACEIGLVDRIFTRIGASDDLSGGKSTFMVEMAEVSNILKNASPDSLILLDEVGRGTSTYDGLAIAWAVAEHLMAEEGVRARTLFATHYHELIALAEDIPGVQNRSVAVKRIGQNIIFLRKIVAGGADESYGVEVARLAGLPKEVIERARQILRNLEAGGKKKQIESNKEQIRQLDFTDFLLQEEGPSLEVVEALKAINVNDLTPLEALLKLSELQALARGGDKD